MMKEENILKWLQKWFKSQCDGNWEFENVCQITSVSNPGWYISIDLAYTGLENIKLDVGTIRNGDDDWYYYLIKDKKFKAAGDLEKLKFLLYKFKEIVELHNKVI
ncbi:MAG: immunity 53 family protein [Chitinophagaceae bacterium]